MSSFLYGYEEMPSDLSLNGASLPDWIQLPEIHRILNNKYQIYIVYKLDGQNVDYLKKGNFVKAKWVDGSYQYFELSNPVKNLNSISVVGRHIGFMLNRNFIEKSFTSSGNGKAIMANLYSSLVFKQKFVFDSDVTTNHQFTAKEVQPLEAIIGSNNGNQNLVGVTKGELDFDNYNVTLKKRIGSDNGYRIGFGQNLASIEEDVNDDGIINSLYLIGGTPENDYNENKDPIVFKYLEISGVTDKTRRIGKRENSNLITQADIKKWGQSLFDDDRIHEPVVTHDVSMVDLSTTMEYQDLYKKLSRLQFGDTAHVNVSKLRIRISERLVECVWYPTIEKYKSMVLGNDLSMYTYQAESKVQAVKQDLINSQQMMVENVKNATSWITGNSGGYVILRPEKAPEEILIMDDPDVTKAMKVWRWNLGGLGYSKKGVNGPYETAITQDGHIVADFIKAGVLSGVKIQGVDEDFLIELYDGKIRFLDINTKEEIGVLAPSFSDGKLQGYSFIQMFGKSFTLSTQRKDKKGHVTVLEIPAESHAEEPLLNLNGKVNLKGEFYVNGVKIDTNGGGSGGGSGGGNLGSREDYAKNMKSEEFNVNYDKMYADWVNFGRIRAWGINNRQTFDQYNGILKNLNISPTFFWAYEGSEGYNSDLSFLNHFEKSSASPEGELRRTAQWLNETANKDGELAWYDAQYPYYTSPADKQAVGNAYMADTKPGMIARVMLQGTAAATWAMFDPPALSASVNLKQDYGDPFEHQMSLISKWQNETTYGMPVPPGYTITSWYGDRDDPTNPGNNEFHKGMDFADALGTPIYASTNGVVSLSIPPEESGGFGNYVTIKGSDGKFTGYGHMNSRMVSAGQSVSKGQQIGTMGTTGSSTGVHLHFSVGDGDYGPYEDPAGAKYLNLKK